MSKKKSLPTKAKTLGSSLNIEDKSKKESWAKESSESEVSSLIMEEAFSAQQKLESEEAKIDTTIVVKNQDAPQNTTSRWYKVWKWLPFGVFVLSVVTLIVLAVKYPPEESTSIGEISIFKFFVVFFYSIMRC